jgi:hypothetical protein
VVQQQLVGPLGLAPQRQEQLGQVAVVVPTTAHKHPQQCQQHRHFPQVLVLEQQRVQVQPAAVVLVLEAVAVAVAGLLGWQHCSLGMSTTSPMYPAPTRPGCAWLQPWEHPCRHWVTQPVGLLVMLVPLQAPVGCYLRGFGPLCLGCKCRLQHHQHPPGPLALQVQQQQVVVVQVAGQGQQQQVVVQGLGQGQQEVHSRQVPST